MNPLTQFAAGEKVNQVGNNTLVGDVQGILTVIISALGIVAVGVMIVGGVQYMTSAGDTSKVEKGKKTVLYGLIGLIVCALAFVIVQFVINGVLGNDEISCGEGTHYDANTSSCVADD